jgi:hypothetical protein
MCGEESEELDRQCCPDCNQGIRRMAEQLAKDIDEEVLQRILENPDLLNGDDE